MQSLTDRQEIIEKEKIKYVDCIRVIATILVVIGHSAFYKISTNIPGMGYDSTSFLSDDSMMYRIISMTIGIIYSFHMQLFFLLSGIVFAICINKRSDKYDKFPLFFKIKCKRLLQPYFLVSLFYNIPIYIFCGYFVRDTIKNIILYFWGYGQNHLWFLITLFCFLIFTNWLRIYFDKYYLKILFPIAAVAWILVDCNIVNISEFLYFDRLFKYYFWFLLGLLFQKRVYPLVNRRIKKEFCIVVFGIWVGMWIICRLVFPGVNLSILKEFVGVLFMLFFSMMLVSEKSNLTNNRVYNLLSKYSFEIYLFGTPINYLILTFIKIFFHNLVLNNLTTLILFFVRIILQIVFAIGIAIIRKHSTMSTC